MNRFPSRRFPLIDFIFGALVVAAVLQTVNAYAWSAGGWLDRSWLGTAVIVVGALAACVFRWRSAVVADRREFLSAWAWPLPWVFLGIMLWQIAVYPPAMSDSLCYRLPRIFLWLQDGAIGRTGAADGRSVEMPWGWEILALPLVALNLVNWVALVNLTAWAAMLQLSHHWAREAGADRWKARWISLAMATSPAFLLQAVSSANDLLAAVLLAVSLHFILSFGKAPQWGKIFLSLLPLMMAGGVKPQFLVLGAAWGFWWIFDPSRPWQHTRLAVLAVIGGPLALLVSPLPTLLLNYRASGAIFGEGMTHGLVSGSPFFKAVASPLQFLSAQLQLPVMPGAERITAAMQSLEPVRAVHAEVAKFEPEVLLIPIIDKASFGLIHFGLLVAGVALALGSARSRWLLGFVLAAFLLAGSQVVPGTIGRSFLGFGAVLIPLAVAGLAGLDRRWLIGLCVVATGGGGIAMVLNPSAPAWPSREMEEFARESGRAEIAEKLRRYHAYQERAQTGAGFLDPVPAGEPVAVLLRGFTPIVRLWTPDWREHRIDFVHETPAEEFAAGGHRWLIIGDNAAETFPEQVGDYRALEGWEAVREGSFLITLTQGPERWVLYRRAGDSR